MIHTGWGNSQGENMFSRSGNLNDFTGRSGNFACLEKVGNFYVLSNVMYILIAMAIFWKLILNQISSVKCHFVLLNINLNLRVI